MDWFRFDVATAAGTQLTVTPPAFSGDRTAELDPIVELYDSQLRLIDEIDRERIVGEVEQFAWNAATGTHYVRISNFTGSESPVTT